jgi:hypothetical protein
LILPTVRPCQSLLTDEKTTELSSETCPKHEQETHTIAAALGATANLAGAALRRLRKMRLCLCIGHSLVAGWQRLSSRTTMRRQKKSAEHETTQKDKTRL